MLNEAKVAEGASATIVARVVRGAFGERVSLFVCRVLAAVAAVVVVGNGSSGIDAVFSLLLTSCRCYTVV